MASAPMPPTTPPTIAPVLLPPDPPLDPADEAGLDELELFETASLALAEENVQNRRAAHLCQKTTIPRSESPMY